MPLPETISKAHGAIVLLAEGMTLSDALQTVDLSRSGFQGCLTSVSEVKLAYIDARRIQAHVSVDEMLQIADSEADPQKARNQIDVRKWRASKFDSATFGEKLEVHSTATLNILDTRSEALARVLPGRYQAAVQDAEIVDIPALSTGGSFDKQSDAPPEPDIFS